MDEIFNLCVDFLVWLARLTGMTYNEINVVIFVIIWPLFSIIMFIIIIIQHKKIIKLKKQIYPHKAKNEKNI